MIESKNIYQTSLDFKVKFSRYSNGQLALYIQDQNGLPITELSTMMPKIDLEENEFILRDYSKNATYASKLLESNIIRPTNKFVFIGTCMCPICALPY